MKNFFPFPSQKELENGLLDLRFQIGVTKLKEGFVKQTSTVFLLKVPSA